MMVHRKEAMQHLWLSPKALHRVMISTPAILACSFRINGLPNQQRHRPPHSSRNPKVAFDALTYGFLGSKAVTLKRIKINNVT